MGTVMRVPILPWRNQAESPKPYKERHSHPKDNTLEDVTWGLAYLTSC